MQRQDLAAPHTGLQGTLHDPAEVIATGSQESVTLARLQPAASGPFLKPLHGGLVAVPER
ncbi:MAG: hypothetical protein ABIW19_08355 [Vicinamibacterales bacterium]